MKMINLTIAASVLAISGSASASSLQPRLGGLAYYDDVAGLTWLADANYAQTSGYDLDGRMNWTEATAWAANLTVGGVSGWRLPYTVDVGNDGSTFTNRYQGVDFGFNITAASEMSNMFYNVLGNLAYYNTSGVYQPGYGVSNAGPFSNLKPSYYWSATRLRGGYTAWDFDMYYGAQNYNSTTNPMYAWAVQSGDVSPVPVPAAIWLFGSGLIGLMGLARRKC